MNRQIIVDSAKCTGCGLCMIACSIKKTGQCDPSLARIKIWREDTWGLFIPMTCQQCIDPPCAGACLMNVISKDESNRVTIRRLEGCIGCRVCQAACPFEASNYNHLLDVVTNCDQCSGDPECVKYCPYGALQYEEVAKVLDSWRMTEALKRISI